MEDVCVLFKTTFSYETPTEHVEEICFEHPIYLTGFRLGEVNGTSVRLRVYAKDALYLSGSRLVPLFNGIAGTNKLFQLQKTISEKVVIRFETTRLNFTLLGHNHLHSVGEKQTEKPFLSTERKLQGLEKCGIPFRASCQDLPFVDGFPSALNSVLTKLSQGQDLPRENMSVIFQSADLLCQRLGISAVQSSAQLEVEKCELVSSGVELAKATKTVVRWMERMGVESGVLSSKKENSVIENGMLSLALSCVLCSCRITLMHFISNGGVSSLIGIFRLRGATALMTRYLVCTSELLSLVGGVIGCEALLGYWKHHPYGYEVPAENSEMIHVPGIINAKVRKEDGKRGEVSSPKLPPGMISKEKKSHRELEVDQHRGSKVEESSKKKSSRSKKEKRKKSRHKTNEKQSHSSSRYHHHHEEKESKRHRHRHRPSLDLMESNGGGNTSTLPQEDSRPSIKRQKLGHPPQGADLKSINLNHQEGLVKEAPLYDIMFDIIFQPRPKGIIESVHRILDRLNLYKSLSNFQLYSEEISDLLMMKTEKSNLDFSFSEVKENFISLKICLGQIFSFMKDSIKKIDLDIDNNYKADQEYNKGAYCTSHNNCKYSTKSFIPSIFIFSFVKSDFCRFLSGLWSVLELDESFLEFFSGTQFFLQVQVIIKVLSLPLTLFMKDSKSEDQEQWNQTKNSIFSSLSSLITIILSSPNGLTFLKHHSADFFKLEETRNPGSLAEDPVGVFWKKIKLLVKILDCCGVLTRLLSGNLVEQETHGALYWIAELLQDSSLAAQVIPLAVGALPEAVEKLCVLMEEQNQQLRALIRLPKEMEDEENQQKIPAFVSPIFQIFYELSKLAYHPAVLSIFLQYHQQIQKSLQLEEEVKSRVLGPHQEDGKQVKELLSGLEICRGFQSSQWSGILTELAALLPPLSKAEKISKEECVRMFNDSEKQGRISMCFQILICLMKSNLSTLKLSAMYGANLLTVLERALRSGVSLIEVGSLDLTATVMTGEFKNDLKLHESFFQTMKFFQIIIHACLVTFKALKESKMSVKSFGCAESLVEAYSVLALTPESMLALLRKQDLHSLHPILKSKEEISEILLIWMEASWTPSVLDMIFDSPCTSGVQFLARPVKIFSKCCLLGDLFQEEWPPLPHITREVGALPSPCKMKIRAQLANGLEYHERAFKYLIEYGLGSESHIVRCVVVRLCVRAAGLGGGMGLFLIEPIMKEMAVLIKNNGTPSDYYRLVEMVSSLAPWPALKAAFLDSKLVSSISRLLHGLAPDCQQEESLLSVCSAFLDIFRILMDPEICLHPFEVKEKCLQLDCPGSSELGVMVAALLANLSHFSPLENNVLELLKTTGNLPEGRSILLRGISRWRTAYANTNTEVQEEILIQWAQEQLQKDKADSTDSVCQSVVDYISSLKTPEESLPQSKDPGAVERPSAPTRFKELVQRTQGRVESKKVKSSEDVFWEFVHSFPTVHLKKKWSKWNCQENEIQSSFEFYNSSFLTASTRPRSVIKPSPPLYFPDPVPDHSQSTILSPEKPKSAIGEQLPPVLVLPRRTPDNRRNKMMTGGSSSRLPSIHVDEYQKTTTPTSEEAQQTNNSSSLENKNQTTQPLSPLPVAQQSTSTGVKDPVSISQGLDQLSLKTMEPKKALEKIKQDTISAGIQSQTMSKEYKNSSTVVSIPGIGNVVNATVMIPGLGLTNSNKKTRSHVDQPTQQHGSDNSPIAPQFSSSSGEERANQVADSMIIDKTNGHG